MKRALLIAILVGGCGSEAPPPATATPPPAAMLAAAERGDAPSLARLLDLGIAVDATDDAGNTGLLLAAAAGHAPAVQLLLARGAGPNRAAKGGTTPLLIATVRGHAEVVSLLLAGKADHRAREPQLGMAPLALAAFKGHAAIARALLAAGADPDAEDGDGQRPLDRAIAAEHAELVALLQPVTRVAAPQWLPAGWSWHRLFTDQSPWWTEYAALSPFRDPPGSVRALARSALADQAQVFFVLGPAALRAAADAWRAEMRSHPLLRRHAQSTVTLADGRTLAIDDFEIGEGRIGGREVRHVFGTLAQGERVLVVDAGGDPAGPLADRVAKMLAVMPLPAALE